MKPETVVGWHRAGFRLYWRWRSRPRGRGPKTTAEIRILIRRIAEENAGWSTPKILHFNVARHPTTEWVVQQLRGAFPEAGPYRYVILDRDSKFDADVIGCLKATGLRPTRTGIPSPWQNRTTERWVGSCRRELLDHVIPLNERRLGGLHHRYSRRQAA